MSVKIKPAFLAIVVLASPLLISTNAANAAPESCLTAPGKPGPQGSRWYYRLEFPSKRKCWHLVLKGGKPAAAARVTQPPAEDDTDAAAAPAPAPVASAPEPAKPAPEPVIQTLVTRNASNPGAIVPSPGQTQTASMDDSANAVAPAEEAAATEPAPLPVAESTPPRAVVAPAETSEPSRISIVSLLPALVALIGLLACAAYFVVEMRRRRTDVLNSLRNDEALFRPAPPAEPQVSPAERATFAPLPAMRPMPTEDDVDLALRRFARRRAA
jgi:hypothetical protein